MEHPEFVDTVHGCSYYFFIKTGYGTTSKPDASDEKWAHALPPELLQLIHFCGILMFHVSKLRSILCSGLPERRFSGEGCSLNFCEKKHNRFHRFGIYLLTETAGKWLA